MTLENALDLVIGLSWMAVLGYGLIWAFWLNPRREKREKRETFWKCPKCMVNMLNDEGYIPEGSFVDDGKDPVVRTICPHCQHENRWILGPGIWIDIDETYSVAEQDEPMLTEMQSNGH